MTTAEQQLCELITRYMDQAPTGENDEDRQARLNVIFGMELAAYVLGYKHAEELAHGYADTPHHPVGALSRPSSVGRGQA